MNTVNKLIMCFIFDVDGYVIFDDLTLMRIKKFFNGYASFMIQRRYLDYNVKVGEEFIDSQCRQVRKIVKDFDIKSRKIHETQLEHVIYELEHKIRVHLEGVLPV